MTEAIAELSAQLAAEQEYYRSRGYYSPPPMICEACITRYNGDDVPDQCHDDCPTLAGADDPDATAADFWRDQQIADEGKFDD